MFAEYATAAAVLIVVNSLRLTDAREKVHDAWICLGIFAGACYSLPAATFLTGNRHVTFDPAFQRIDAALGIDGRALCLYANMHPAFWKIITAVYFGVPLWIAFVYVCERSSAMLESLALGLLVCPLFYVVFPAVGPAHAFPGWPYVPPQLIGATMHVQQGDLPRNCFPSGHLMLAPIPFLSVRSWRLRIPAGVFLFFTACATVGSGEHYAIDLLAAVPYSLLAMKAQSALGARLSRRKLLGGAGRGAKPAGRVLPPAASASLAPVAGTPANRPLPARLKAGSSE